MLAWQLKQWLCSVWSNLTQSDTRKCSTSVNLTLSINQYTNNVTDNAKCMHHIYHKQTFCAPSQCAKAIRPTSAPVGLCTAMRGPTAAQWPFAHWITTSVSPTIFRTLNIASFPLCYRYCTHDTVPQKADNMNASTKWKQKSNKCWRQAPPFDFLLAD